jgi:hypothetical protein
MKLTVKPGGVPPGSYIAKFVGFEEKPGFEGKPGLLWTCEVASGPFTGSRPTGFTPLEPSAGNKCGRFLAGVLGRMPGVGETTDLTPCVGKPYLIVVEATDKGGSKIVSITAPPA